MNVAYKKNAVYCNKHRHTRQYATLLNGRGS